MLAVALDGWRKGWHRWRGKTRSYKWEIHQNHYPKRPGRLLHIVRDPRDVAVSIYHYFNSNVPTVRAALDGMVTGQGRHLSYGWVDYVTRWMEQGIPMVRYEDLKRDTTGELARLLDDAGINYDPALIKTAVNENKIAASRKRGLKKPEFYRKGVVGDWVNHLSIDDNRYALEHFGELMERLNYE